MRPFVRAHNAPIRTLAIKCILPTQRRGVDLYIHYLCYIAKVLIEAPRIFALLNITSVQHCRLKHNCPASAFMLNCARASLSMTLTVEEFINSNGDTSFLRPLRSDVFQHSFVCFKITVQKSLQKEGNSRTLNSLPLIFSSQKLSENYEIVIWRQRLARSRQIIKQFRLFVRQRHLDLQCPVGKKSTAVYAL